MLLLSWNINGIRAAVKKGFLSWLESCGADAVCLQEVKARPDQVPAQVRQPGGWHVAWNPAERPGYSGVVTLQRERPGFVATSFGDERFDDEGRVLVTEVGDTRLYNVYFPNGKSGPERLRYKLAFCDALLEHLVEEKRRRRRLVVCGDYNTAHREIDLAHPRQNSKVSGFLPEERAWLDRLVAAGFVDTFRLLYPAETGRYTWWSPLTNARARNVGWRIDYFFVGSNLVKRVRGASILAEVAGSDHCPVGLELAD